MFGLTCDEEEEAEEPQQRRVASETVACGGGLPLYLHLVSWAESLSHSVSMVYPPGARPCSSTLCPLPACLAALASAWSH